MTESNTKTDDELSMDLLCKDLDNFKKQLDNSRVAKISAAYAILNFWDLIEKTAIKIKELERKGIKRVEAAPSVIETPFTKDALLKGG